MSQERKAVQVPKAHKKPDQGNGKRVRLTQQAIVAAAAELFARNGFGATSLDDIATTLGVTKGAFYYHVKNKEEILRLIYLTVLTVSEEPLRRIVESDFPPLEKLRRAVEHHTAVAADRSPAMMVFYREQSYLTGPFAKEILLRKKAYERYFEQIMQEGQAAGIFKPDLELAVPVVQTIRSLHAPADRRDVRGDGRAWLGPLLLASSDVFSSVDDVIYRRLRWWTSLSKNCLCAVVLHAKRLKRALRRQKKPSIP